MPNHYGKDRKADKLAGGGSFLDKLKRRRKAIESGDASGGSAFKAKDRKIRKSQNVNDGGEPKLRYHTES